jgi:hypothetical protein
VNSVGSSAVKNKVLTVIGDQCRRYLGGWLRLNASVAGGHQQQYMTPLFVTKVDSEEVELNKALDLNPAEDKMLQQNACHNVRKKMMVRMNTKLTNPSA